MEIDQIVLFFLIVFLIVFLVDYLFILKRKSNYLLNNRVNKKKKKVDIMEISYLAFKFKIEKTSLYKKSIILWISFLNAFIISLVSTVISSIPLKMGWQLLIGFVLLFGLIYAIYDIFGRILVKKGY